MLLNDTKEVKLPPNKIFGGMFSAIFLVAAIYFSLELSIICASLSVFLSIIIYVISLWAPALLSPFNYIWYRLGEILSRLVQPIVLGVIYYLILTPLGVITRIAGRDFLRLKGKESLNSYWIERSSANNDQNSFKNQF